jgi:hypothetical protein
MSSSRREAECDIANTQLRKAPVVQTTRHDLGRAAPVRPSKQTPARLSSRARSHEITYRPMNAPVWPLARLR